MVASVLDLASKVSGVFQEYLSIHQEVFRFSLRGLIGTGKRNGRIDHAARGRRLGKLIIRLQSLQRDVRSLERTELARRSKNEVRSVLLDYAAALESSMSQLQAICSNLQYESDEPDADHRYSETELRADKVRYDDSIQEYKRLGARLTELISKV